MRKCDIVHQKITHNNLSLVCCIYFIPHYVIFIIYHLSITCPSTYNYSFHYMQSMKPSCHVSQSINFYLTAGTEGRPWLVLKQSTLFYFPFKPLKTISCHRHSFLGTVKEEENNGEVVFKLNIHKPAGKQLIRGYIIQRRPNRYSLPRHFLHALCKLLDRYFKRKWTVYPCFMT